MGYDVHITRAEDWTESEETPISLSEWVGHVKTQADLRITGFAEARNPQSEVLRVESEGLAVWTAHPKGNQVWIDYRDGELVVKNPDESILERMRKIARALKARVQGDEGEYYDEEGAE